MNFQTLNRKNAHNRRPIFFSLLVFALLTLCASEAFAGGFSVARFGGGRGTGIDTNPTALYYNPAAPSFSDKGTQIFVDLSTAFRSATYERAVSAISPYSDPVGSFSGPLAGKEDVAKLANSGYASLGNVIAVPMVGITTDFGTDLPFRVGAAFYIPFGGSAVWSKREDADAFNQIFPGSGDGPARWVSIDGTIQTMTVAVGGSYYIDAARLALGLTLNTNISKIETLRARNSDGSDNLVDSTGKLKEGRANLKVSSIDFSFGLGVMGEIVKDKMWLGLSYQSMPNLTGKMTFDGTLQNVLGTGKVSEKPENVLMTWTLPDVYRLSYRYRPLPSLDLKLEASYSRWSVFDQNCILSYRDGDDISRGNIDAICTLDENGKSTKQAANNDPSVLQVFARDWKDSFGLRADFTYLSERGINPSVGIGFDSNAIPDETLDAALIDMNKILLTAGVDVSFTDWLNWGLYFTDVIYFDRDNTEVAAKSGVGTMKGSLLQPGNGGIYTQSVLSLNTNFNFAF